MQDAINPIAVAGAEGRHFWDYDGKRYLDFASQLVNVNIGHQHPKIIAAIKEQADQLCTIGPPMANESRSRLGRLLAEVTPGDLSMSFFTNWRRRGERERDQARAACDRSAQDHRALPLLPRGDARRDHAHRRPAAVADRAGHVGRRADARPVHVPLPGGAPGSVPRVHGRAAPGGDPRVRGRAHGRRGDPRDGDGDERDHPAPDGYLQSIREVCDRHGILLILDEVMAGLRPHRALVRLRELGRRPGHPHGREGDQLGLRAARRDDHPRAARRTGCASRFFPGGLTYAGHPLACASAVASIEAFREEGVVENAAEVGAYLGEALRALAERHPSIGEVRGLGCFWGVELVKNRETREMLVPFNAAGEAAAPVTRLAKAALERGLYLMTHWNVVMVVPPLTITREEVDEGIAILDEALAIADEYVERRLRAARSRAPSSSWRLQCGSEHDGELEQARGAGRLRGKRYRVDRRQQDCAGDEDRVRDPPVAP